MQAALIVLAACALVAGCSSIGGSSTIARDRFDYVSSISDSWKRETLLNLVKIRYTDAPVFLNVTSVINSYSWEAEVNAGGQHAPIGRGDTFLGAGATGRYSDKPTITYAPLTGDKFARNLMTPLQVHSILYLLQSGYRADVVLRMCVASINGLDNETATPGASREGSVQFREVLETIRQEQQLGRFDMRVGPKEHPTITLDTPKANPDGQALDRKLRELLRLDPDAREIAVVMGSLQASKTEIAVLPRSVMQILGDLSSYIEVPEADATEGRVFMPRRTPEQLRLFPPLLRVRSSAEAPPDAFVAVRYRNHWFWIDDRDAPSKAAFNFLMLLSSLTETGEKTSAPILTVPTR